MDKPRRHLDLTKQKKLIKPSRPVILQNELRDRLKSGADARHLDAHKRSKTRSWHLGPSREGIKKLFNDVEFIEPLKKTRRFLQKLLRKASRAFQELLKIKKARRVLFIFVVSLIVVSIVTGVRRGNNSASEQFVNSGTNQTNSDVLAKVDASKREFTIVFPEGKTESELEVALISPEGNEPVYAYADTYKGASLKISQQALPDEFKTQQDKKLAELATSFQATSVIEIDGEKVYHGTSKKPPQDTQSLIFIKDKLLIFIVSNTVLSDDDWFSYISRLE